MEHTDDIDAQHFVVDVGWPNPPLSELLRSSANLRFTTRVTESFSNVKFKSNALVFQGISAKSL